MKSFNKLTKEEQKDIVSYSTSDLTVYYSDVVSISPSTLTTSTTSYSISSNLVYEELIEGKAKYEAYKLSMTKSDAEQFISDQADELIKDRFNTVLDSVSGHISSMGASASNICDLESKLESLVTSTSVDDIISKLNSKLSDIRSTSSSFEPIKKDLKEVSTLLHSLFKD